MKLTIVGGGSTYTPELVDGFTRTDLPITELCLVDPDPARLGPVSGMARRMLARAGHSATVVATTDLIAGVKDADAVLLQLRVGGQDTRRADETWPFGDRNCVDLIGGNLCLLKGLTDHRDDRIDVASRGKFREDPAVFLMDICG